MIRFETTPYHVIYWIKKLWWIRPKKQAYSDSNFSYFAKIYLFFDQCHVIRREKNMFKMTTKMSKILEFWKLKPKFLVKMGRKLKIHYEILPPLKAIKQCQQSFGPTFIPHVKPNEKPFDVSWSKNYFHVFTLRQCWVAALGSEGGNFLLKN